LYQLSYTGETVGANHGSRRVYLSRPTVHYNRTANNCYRINSPVLRERDFPIHLQRAFARLLDTITSNE
ncbi:MAG: hypothetical protein ACK53Y_09045, partial [bacterium]